MPRGRPVDTAKRNRAITLMTVKNLPRNQIARQLGLAGATVTDIARQIGHEFNRKDTALAVAARQVDLKAERTELAQMAAARAREALEDMDAPHEVTEFSADAGEFVTHLRNQPSITDRQRLAYTATMLLRTATQLDRSEEGAGVRAGVAVVDGLAAGFGALAAALREEGHDPTALPDQD